MQKLTLKLCRYLRDCFGILKKTIAGQNPKKTMVLSLLGDLLRFYFGDSDYFVFMNFLSWSSVCYIFSN